jgi:hypothetical protein
MCDNNSFRTTLAQDSSSFDIELSIRTYNARNNIIGTLKKWLHI